MKQYFVRIERWYYPKNNLETAIIEKVRSEYNNVLLQENELQNFGKDVSFCVSLLNADFKRAKPLICTKLGSNLSLSIRRDVKEGIDDLVILEAVEVSRVYGLEGGEK